MLPQHVARPSPVVHVLKWSSLHITSTGIAGSASYVAVNMTSVVFAVDHPAAVDWIGIERRLRLLQTRRAALDRYRAPANLPQRG